MRVFSVEMLVKEEGAAVVEAALKRLKGEAKAVAAEMKVTTKQVTDTGTAMKTTGDKTEIAKDRAAKAAIGFAAVGQSFARTGAITADMGTRIVEAGSQIAMMFGPKGLAVAAVLSFTAAAVTSFFKASSEADKMAQAFEKSLQDIVNQGDVIALTKQLRDLEQGTAFGTVETDAMGKAIVNTNDGIAAMRARIEELKRTGFTTFNRQNREELVRLQDELAEAERRAQRLRAAIMAPAPRTAPITAAVTISARAPSAAAPTAATLAAAAGLPRSADVLAAVKRDFDDLIRVKIPQAVAPAIADLSGTIYGQLGIGIANAIQGGIISGLQAVIAAGSIGDAFTAMGQAIVSSLASSMVQVALAAIGFGVLLEKIRVFMMANPAIAVASAVALLALARSMGGSARTAPMTATGGPGGLTYSAAGAMSAPSSQIIFGSTSATTAAGMTPRSSTNVTIIGPNDPVAQRGLQELMAKANSRGRVG